MALGPGSGKKPLGDFLRHDMNPEEFAEATLLGIELYRLSAAHQHHGKWLVVGEQLVGYYHTPREALDAYINRACEDAHSRAQNPTV